MKLTMISSKYIHRKPCVTVYSIILKRRIRLNIHNYNRYCMLYDYPCSYRLLTRTFHLRILINKYTDDDENHKTCATYS